MRINFFLHPFKVCHVVQCLGQLGHSIFHKLLLKSLSVIVVLAYSVVDVAQRVVQVVVLVFDALIP